jgi:hypothetical protein
VAPVGTTFNRLCRWTGCCRQRGVRAGPPGAAASTEAMGSACGSGPHRSPQSDSSFHSLAPSEFQFQPSGHLCGVDKERVSNPDEGVPSEVGLGDVSNPAFSE